MAINFTSMNCPNCGANLTIEEGREKIFCSYCGTQIVVTNENEHIYRHIDEAKIREAEANRAIELKKLEMMELDRAAAEKTNKIKTTASIVLGGIGGFLMLTKINEPIGVICLIAILFVKKKK